MIVGRARELVLWESGLCSTGGAAYLTAATVDTEWLATTRRAGQDGFRRVFFRERLDT